MLYVYGCVWIDWSNLVSFGGPSTIGANVDDLFAFLFSSGSSLDAVEK